MIVFPHVPKTGGTSIRRALEAKFGERVLIDYDHYPRYEQPTEPEVYADIAARADELRQRYDVIYGHFGADLYRSLSAPTAMFFRAPDDRTLSEHSYRLGKGEPMPTPAELAARPKQVTLYKTFLGGYPVEELAFVGLTERFGESLRLFKEIFGINLPERRDRTSEWSFPEAQRQAIIEAQPENWAVYHRATARFEQLIRKYL